MAMGIFIFIVIVIVLFVAFLEWIVLHWRRIESHQEASETHTTQAEEEASETETQAEEEGSDGETETQAEEEGSDDETETQAEEEVSDDVTETQAEEEGSDGETETQAEEEGSDGETETQAEEEGSDDETETDPLSPADTETETEEEAGEGSDDETDTEEEEAAPPSLLIHHHGSAPQVEVHSTITVSSNGNSIAEELASSSSSPPPLVSSARALICQGRRIRKRWSKSGKNSNPIALFGQNKGNRDEKGNIIKEKREIRADILEMKREKVRELRWNGKAKVNEGFLSKYKILNPIGKGGFGAVYEAKLRRNSSFGPFAVKIVSKAEMNTVGREIGFLKKLDGSNTNVVKYYEAHEDSNQLYIVTELCKGGNLYERLKSSGWKFGENEAKRWMVQALNAVAFCHSRGIVHRDIKPENFMCMSDDKNCRIKLIDFGLSDCLVPGGRLGDVVGTPQYMAPEVFRGSSGYESDAWSLGIMAYELLAGQPPFETRVTRHGHAYVDYKIAPDFSSPAWRSVSAKAKEFIKGLLILDPARRMEVHEAQRHRWIAPHLASRRPPLPPPLNAGPIRRVGPTASSSGQAGPTASSSGQAGPTAPTPTRTVATLQVRQAGPTSANSGASHVGPTPRRPPLPPLAHLQNRLAALENMYNRRINPPRP